MPNTTYSSTEVSVVITHTKHGLMGQMVTSGEGWGSISVSMTDDRTKSDIGADGAVMISKIASKRGTIAIEVQQTSELNKFLINAYNIVDAAAYNEWAHFQIIIKELYDNGIRTVGSQCAFQKIADRKNQQNGDMVTWTFMCASVTQGAA